jgi:hypothetical protein
MPGFIRSIFPKTDIISTIAEDPQMQMDMASIIRPGKTRNFLDKNHDIFKGLTINRVPMNLIAVALAKTRITNFDAVMSSNIFRGIWPFVCKHLVFRKSYQDYEALCKHL